MKNKEKLIPGTLVPGIFCVLKGSGVHKGPSGELLMLDKSLKNKTERGRAALFRI